jgi:regulator of PEP synthase PpsR (kinase-PPPase family)
LSPEASGEVIDLLGTHLTHLEDSSSAQQRTGTATEYHRVGDLGRYHDRINAVEYTIEHDDAASFRGLDSADLIILAPSRCGKTPTAMYLALQHGLRVANYPLTDDDAPGRTSRTLSGRFPGQTVRTDHHGAAAQPGPRGTPTRAAGTPASPQCRTELRQAEKLYRSHKIPYIDSHAMSVEEMSSVILTRMNLRQP